MSFVGTFVAALMNKNILRYSWLSSFPSLFLFFKSQANSIYTSLYRVEKMALSRLRLKNFYFSSLRKNQLIDSPVLCIHECYSLSFLRRSRPVVIFSVFARCIDPARDRNRVINSLYLSLTSQALRNSFPMVPFTHVSSLFFRSSIPLSKPSFLFFLVWCVRRVRRTFRIIRKVSRYPTTRMPYRTFREKKNTYYV